MKYNSHYEWLEDNLPLIFQNLGLNWDNHAGIISAHGDKVYHLSYRDLPLGLHFYHAAAIYLLTYVNPFASLVRNTPNGWINPDDMVYRHWRMFEGVLPVIED